MINNILSHPIIKFNLWVFTLLVICFVGISNVFALENNGSLRFYDNNGSSLTYVTTEFVQQTGESSAIFTTTANSYGGALMIQTPTPLIANHIYSLFVNVAAANMGGFTVNSTKNCIGLGSGYSDTINSYVNCSITPKFTQESGVTADKRNGLFFTFIANSNANYIVIAYTSTYTCTNCLQYSYGFNITDGGDTTGLTQTELNNKINQQTITIQTEINNMQQAIAGSIDDMTDDIIANQNQNTEDIINSNRVCNTTNINDIEIQKKYLDNNGNLQNANTTGISKYYKLDGDTIIKLIDTSNSNAYACFYDNDKTKISCFYQPNQSSGVINIPSNAKYFRYTSYLTNGKPVYEICKNGNQATNDAINDLNDTLTDNSASSFDTSLVNVSSNTPITNLLTIPISLLQAILTRTNNSCSPISIPFLFNHTINFPCFNISDYLGSVSNTIDLCVCFVMVYNIFMLFVSIFEDITTLRDGFLGLYEPQHAYSGYKPKHAKD